MRQSLAHVAFHEAGHAVAAWRVGSEIELVTVASDHGLVITHGPTGLHWRDQLERSLLRIYAGPEAQRVFDPASDIVGDGAFDYAAADNLLAIGFGATSESGAALGRIMQREAQALVCRDWPIVAALSAALATRRQLTGPAAVLVMREAASGSGLAAGL